MLEFYLIDLLVGVFVLAPMMWETLKRMARRIRLMEYDMRGGINERQ